MTGFIFHPVANAADIVEGDMIHVAVGKTEIALYNVGGRFYATEAYCSHGHALLTEGYIEGDRVECPMHGGIFEIATGQAVGAPCVTPLASFEVKIEDGKVAVGLPAG